MLTEQELPLYKHEPFMIDLPYKVVNPCAQSFSYQITQTYFLL